MSVIIRFKIVEAPEVSEVGFNVGDEIAMVKTSASTATVDIRNTIGDPWTMTAVKSQGSWSIPGSGIKLEVV